MMLFLPAGLGVYMLTNTWLGITQQVLVERYMKARADRDGGIQVKEKTSPGSGPNKDVPKSDDRVATPALLETGKGKARVRG
jgi:YidC/Oxa1 family membrane protein insertase